MYINVSSADINHINFEILAKDLKFVYLLISSHNLEIEHGRYFNIPADQRICKLCKLTVEDEIHFLLECPKLEEARHDNLYNIENKYKKFQIFG
jgi:hypothetical protein